jgi:hypothetical protein
VHIYNINFSKEKQVLSGNWQSVEWRNAETAELRCIRPESSGFSPLVKVKLLYSDEGISGIFYVEDKFVRCMRTEHMQSVWNDSCVEFFVKPFRDEGYFNFEFNCIGVLYASYILNCERTGNGFKDFKLFKKKDCNKIKVISSLNGPIEPEYKDPLIWTLQFFIPFSLIEQFTGKQDSGNKGEWSCNFYKCADESSHPHWISWSPVRELNFHAPESFGKLLFEKR